MNQSLTLLQRGVMKRLSDQGHQAFAEQLHARWIHGERADLVIYSVEKSNPKHIASIPNVRLACFEHGGPQAEYLSPELADDLERANAQATAER